MINAPHYKSLVVIAIVIAMTLVVFSDDEIVPKQLTQNNPTSDKAEAFIEGAQFTLYDNKGFPIDLISDKALFYAHSERIDIEGISGSLSNEIGEVIQLSSKHGQIAADSNTITLSGSVLIEQTLPENKAWSIQGEEFVIDKQQGFISSNQAVTITRNQSVIQATGLKGWLNEKRIELLSNVRGQYAFTN